MNEGAFFTVCPIFYPFCVFTSSSYNGNVQGSCFPPSFGGSCTGTPPKCRECNSRCAEKDKGMTITVKLDDNGTWHTAIVL